MSHEKKTALLSIESWLFNRYLNPPVLSIAPCWCCGLIGKAYLIHFMTSKQNNHHVQSIIYTVIIHIYISCCITNTHPQPPTQQEKNNTFMTSKPVSFLLLPTPEVHCLAKDVAQLSQEPHLCRRMDGGIVFINKNLGSKMKYSFLRSFVRLFVHSFILIN